MKQSIAAIICLTVSLFAARGAAPGNMAAQQADIPQGYSLVWSDEFNGTALDRSVWNVEVNDHGGGNQELQYYIDSPENITVADGCLRIAARKVEHQGRSFTSGRINTLGKMHFQYGILEASIRIPETDGGLWPAFWAMGADITECGWPRCGETDILEMGHHDGMAQSVPRQLFNGALHWGPGQHMQTVGVSTHPTPLQDGEFHRFRLVWTPQRLEMSVDGGEPYLVADISESSTDKSPGAYFNKPNFILFNMAVGGLFTGLLTPDEITALGDHRRQATLEVDYVRLYQRPGETFTLAGQEQ